MHGEKTRRSELEYIIYARQQTTQSFVAVWYSFGLFLYLAAILTAIKLNKSLANIKLPQKTDHGSVDFPWVAALFFCSMALSNPNTV